MPLTLAKFLSIMGGIWQGERAGKLPKKRKNNVLELIRPNEEERIIARHNRLFGLRLLFLFGFCFVPHIRCV
jgi:hypothetical protein